MRTQRFAVLAGFVVCLLPLGTLNASQDFIDYLAPPRSLQKMYDAAVVVARIRLLTQGPPTAQSSDPHPLVVHHHTIQVLESFKSKATRTEGPTLRLEQYGGTVVVNGQTFTTAYPAPLLEPNAEAVVFLDVLPDDEYSLMWGSGALFLVNTAAGTVAVPSVVAHYVADFDHRPWVPLDELFGKLRAIRDKRP